MKIEEKDMYKTKRIKIKSNYGFENEFIGILVKNNNAEDYFTNSLDDYNCEPPITKVTGGSH